jgi:hypothetical protein
MMATVRLTVFKAGFRWSLEVEDRRGNRFIGATASRAQIEALALRLMVEAEARGDDAEVIFAPKHYGSQGAPRAA